MPYKGKSLLKIIRVSGCHGCPEYIGYCCNKTDVDVHKYADKKELPDNCPLEDERIPNHEGYTSAIPPEDSFEFLNDKGEDIYSAEDGTLINKE